MYSRFTYVFRADFIKAEQKINHMDRKFIPDKKTIEKAKKLGLENTEVLEKAKERNEPLKFSESEQTLLNFDSSIEWLEKNNRCRKIDVKTKKLKIKDFRGFDEREIEFEDLTLIKGANGEGKTSIFDAVKYGWLEMRGSPHDYPQADVKLEGEMVEEAEEGCWIFDCPFPRLDPRNLRKIVNHYFQNLEAQIIVLTGNMDFPEENFDKVIDIGKKHLLNEKEKIEKEIDEMYEELNEIKERRESPEGIKKMYMDIKHEVKDYRAELEQIKEDIEEREEELEKAESDEMISTLESKKKMLIDEKERLEEDLEKNKGYMDKLSAKHDEAVDLKLKMDKLNIRIGIKEHELENIKSRLEKRSEIDEYAELL